jgi:hypothetical protein
MYIPLRKQKVLARVGYIGWQNRSMNKCDAAYLSQAGILVGRLTLLAASNAKY